MRDAPGELLILKEEFPPIVEPWPLCWWALRVTNGRGADWGGVVTYDRDSVAALKKFSVVVVGSCLRHEQVYVRHFSRFA